MFKTEPVSTTLVINTPSWWVDRISTGNNDLIYYDVNGDSVRINRWTDITLPSRPPQVKDIEIL